MKLDQPGFNWELKTYFLNSVSSVIRQKSESQNGGNKKTKHVKFSEKQTFLTKD